MQEMSLVSICITAFIMVFLLLAILAAVMRIINTLFPYREGEEPKKPVRRPTAVSAAPAGVPAAGQIDAAIVVALTTVVAAAHPGAKISNVKEIW